MESIETMLYLQVILGAALTHPFYQNLPMRGKEALLQVAVVLQLLKKVLLGLEQDLMAMLES